MVGSDGALTVTPQFAISGVGPAWSFAAANGTLPVTAPRRISGFCGKTDAGAAPSSRTQPCFGHIGVLVVPARNWLNGQQFCVEA